MDTLTTQDLESLSDDEVTSLLYDYDFILRDEQKLPDLSKPWRTWLILSGRGWGKALHDDMVLQTPHGESRIGDAYIGQQIYGDDGKLTTITGVYPQGIRPLYRMSFSDGTTVDCDEEHLWMVKQSNRRFSNQTTAFREPRVITTKQIIMDMARGIRYTIPLNAPVAYEPNNNIKSDRYTIGLLLGDGCLSSKYRTVSITTSDYEIVDHFKNCGYQLYKCGKYSFAVQNCPDLDEDLVKLGLRGSKSHTKQLSHDLKYDSIDNRLALLQGLMDTDGTCDSKGNVAFCSTSQQLANDVVWLARSLGYRSKITYERHPFYYQDGVKIKGRIAYEVSITGPNKEQLFRLARKRSRVNIANYNAKAIVSITKIANGPATCITVDNQSKLFLTNDFTVTHNSQAGSMAVQHLVMNHGYRNIGLVGPDASDVRGTMIQKSSGIMAICHPHNKPRYAPSNRICLHWENGAIASAYSAEDPEGVRGDNTDLLWMDELCAWKYLEDTYTQAMMTNRIGKRPRVIITTTPKPSKILKQIMEDPTTVITRGTTFDNYMLSPDVLETYQRIYGGTNIGRQELYGEVLDLNNSGLFKTFHIDRGRISASEKERILKLCTRIVVAIDPAVTSAATSDECGLVVVGRDKEGNGYIFEDATMKATPEQWARKAVQLYRDYKADRIVAETNNGGDMVEFTLRTIDRTVSYKKVTASRGKVTRAEPIAALYEQNKIHHVGLFASLEDQMTNWIPGMDSPDRMDAMVWGMTELLLTSGTLSTGKTAFGI